MKEKVYFIPVEDREDPSSIAKKVKHLYEQSGADSGFQKGDYIAVKAHFGESDNTTYLHPLLVKAVIDRLKQKGAFPFLTETSTLYRGKRSNAIDHIKLAHEHGFGFEKIGVPLIMADGIFGDSELVVDIRGKHFSEVNIAREIAKVQGLVVLSHFKGHMAFGFGGALKNIGMGLASRKGKLRQHSVMSPEINRVRCTACGVCIRWCPQEAIDMVDGKAFIYRENCIGCGECLAVCKFDAVRYDFQRDSASLQEMSVEHVAGVLTAVKGNAFFMNFLINITIDCDCGNGGSRVSRDIGLLAGHDVVAIDRASCDIFESMNGKSFREATRPHLDPFVQIKHAQALGLGSIDYELVELAVRQR